MTSRPLDSQEPATETRQGRARYRRIVRFALRYMVLEWWFELFLPRIGLSGVSARNRTKRIQGIARHFHDLALELGGLMIKVGQFLSTRLDVLPPEITGELEGLQDKVPPVDFAAIRFLAEAELGMPLERAYSSFDPVPIAAASLGQAHRATLTEMGASDTGFEHVVVKVQRPGIEAIVEVDLAALRRVAGWLSRVRLIARYADFVALIEEFAQISLLEIDYLHEAASAERFAEDFAADPVVVVPEIAWERTTRRVLSLSDVSAIKINDVDGLRAAGIDPEAVASELARVTFDQLFVHGFFHADPHPGNIFVGPSPVTGGDGPGFQLRYVDFGMMGEVPDTLRSGLRKLAIAVASRDGKGLVASIQDVGVLLPSADNSQLETAMSELFDRFGGMGIADLQDVDRRELTDFADRFQDVVRTMPFQLPENFILIIRASSLVSGVTSSLNPRFNMWGALEPYAGKLIRDQSRGVVRDFAQQATTFASTVARLPRRMDELTTRIERGQLAVQAPGVETGIRTLERMASRVLSALVFAGLVIGGALLRETDLVFGTILMWASVIPLLHTIFSGWVGRRARSGLNRSGRRP